MGEFLKTWAAVTVALVMGVAAFTWLMNTFGLYALWGLVLLVSGFWAYLIVDIRRG